MKISKYLIVIFLPLLSFSQKEANAQSKKLSEYNGPLAIGDKVPDISLGTIINYKEKTASFSDFAGKLLILDFWATYCGPCVKDLPKLYSLQKLFGGKIQIMPVTAESITKVEAWLNKIGLNIQTVVLDSRLSILFPHGLIPHEVWIDENGKVVAITSDTAVTESNINKYLNHQKVVFNEKMDQIYNFDRSKPLFVAGNGGTGDDFIYRSILTGYTEGIGGFINMQSKKKLVKSISLGNVTALMMYYEVYTMHRHIGAVNIRNVIIEHGDTSFILDSNYSKSGPWSYTVQDKYCYNLILPDFVPDTLFFRNYMLDDLNRFFHLKGRIEKRLVPCLVLICKENHAKNLLSTHLDSIPRYIFKQGWSGGSSQDIIESIQNRPFDDLVTLLSVYPNTPPIVNETGYASEQVDIVVHLKWQMDDAWNHALDVTALRKSLNKYGLDIIVENRQVDLLILTTQ